MKRFLTLALTFAMCLTLVSCSGTTTSESPASTGTASAAEADDTVYELKLAHIYAADHPFNVGLNQIAQEISDQTDGHVQHHGISSRTAGRRNRRNQQHSVRLHRYRSSWHR